MMAPLQQKQRESNLELFRIVVMLLIIAHHYVVNSDIWGIIRTEGPSIHSFFYYVLGMWGKTGINCFVLITGWFMCTSQITLRKFLKLLLEIEFYRFVIGLVFLSTGKMSFSGWLLGLLPVYHIKSDFISGFLIFFLFIPFMNILIRNMNRKLHLTLIGLLLFVYSLLGTIPLFSVSVNYVSWFCTLYFVASFMRLYDFPLKNGRAASWALVSVGAIFLSVMSVWAIILSGKNVSPYWFVSDSNKIMALVSSLCFFNLFRTIKLPYNKLINIIGSTTFGVFLIHANSRAMRQWLWYDLFDNAGHISSHLYAILVILLVFIVCSGIDFLRIVLFEKPLFHCLDRRYFDKKATQ